MSHYLNSTDGVMKELGTSADGLSVDEAALRLERDGKNELTRQKKKSLIMRFIEQLINPMIIILLVAAAVSLTIAITHGGEDGSGDSVSEYAEACVILAVVLLNTLLGVFQESKAEKSIEALSDMNTPSARVKRGGFLLQVPSTDLVVGDVVALEAGDTVPADMRLIQSASLRVEEAALTGESVPVDKHTKQLKSGKESKISLGDRKNMAYMGSGVAYGRGEGVVTAVGMNTEIGKIAGIIQSTREGETPLQKRLSQLSKILTIVVLGICAVIFTINLFREQGSPLDALLPSFMLAISLAVAAIPEGLAAVVTIVLSIGVTNMAKRRAIIRKLTVVETLGCAQIICSDKTGTLTQNKMTVVDSYGDEELLIRAMALCCDSQLSPDGSILGDPTENALISYALSKGMDKNQLDAAEPRRAEAPFDSQRKMMSTVHEEAAGIVQYTKGAPDEVLRVCTHAIIDGKIVELTESIKNDIIEKNKQYADRALRVLACAFKKLDEVPTDCAPESLEKDMVFVGLEAMIDPVRPEATAAVAACNSSGIKVVMITGDHIATAKAIAKELGLMGKGARAITGQDLDKLSDEQFEREIDSISVYARVQPEHKVRIVNMWKHKGYVAAMTGDGVNDAPAIKSGDIGVGMGITGTNVTKNVADMVLADDNFATIVVAVEEGRRIYDNIRKTIQFLLGSNLSEVLSIFVATMMGFVLFKPVHLLFINLITDSIPAVALGMEPAEKGIMERPPRGQKEGVFSRGLGTDMLYQGALVAALTLAAYFIVDNLHANKANNHEYAMSAAFLTMSLCEMFHAFNMRSQRQSIFSLKKQNVVLWGALAMSFALTMLIIYVAPLSAIFSLEPLELNELLISVALALIVIPVVEVVKLVQRRFEAKKQELH